MPSIGFDWINLLIYTKKITKSTYIVVRLGRKLAYNNSKQNITNLFPNNEKPTLHPLENPKISKKILDKTLKIITCWGETNLR